MSDNQQPQEPEKTVYQRDKTAKEPVKPGSEAKKPAVKPKFKPKKVFVPKKAVLKTDKPQEYRVRHLRMSSLEAAEMIRQTLLEFQKELEEKPADDPDKEFHDREKLEKFFGKLAKKYSNCATRALGGDLGWVYKGMTIPEEVLTADLLETILKTEKHVLAEPVKSRLGIHLLLVCESRIRTPKKEEAPSGPNPKSIPGVPN